MTSFAFPPKTIEELDKQLEDQYETLGKSETWKEDREWLIKLYKLQEANNEASDPR